MHSKRNRTPAVYFDEILRGIMLIRQYCDGVSFEQLRDESAKRDAVLYRLLVITEAAHRLYPEEQEMCAGPDWRKICDAGNVLRHNYDSVMLPAIWTVIQTDLPALKVAVEKTMREHFPQYPIP